MAKITGISGMIQGKVGPNVYRVTRGVQVVSQYNPNPNNPNSPGQIAQRSIFGSAVKLAKACYDDSVTGRIFKSVSYKQRNALISAILEDNPRTQTITGSPDIVVNIDEIKETWVPGFGEVNATAEISSENLKVNITTTIDGTMPSIAGAIIVKVSRPVPGMSLDDSIIYNLPMEAIAQGIVSLFDVPVEPGELDALELPLVDFAYAPSFGPKYAMPTKAQGFGGDAYSTRWWFIIPFSTEYLGAGLRLEMDGVLYTFGKMQTLWSAPTGG